MSGSSDTRFWVWPLPFQPANLPVRPIPTPASDVQLPLSEETQMAICAPFGRNGPARAGDERVGGTSIPSAATSDAGKRDPLAMDGEVELHPHLLAATTMTRAQFSLAFDRCFDRVYAYVNRRVEDRATCERVVGEVLAVNLHLLVDGGNENQIARALKATADERMEEGRSSGSSVRMVGA